MHTDRLRSALRGARLLAAAGGLSLAATGLAQPPPAPAPTPPATPPSDAPFWARPRPGPNAPTPTQCEPDAQAPAPGAGSAVPLDVLLAVLGTLGILFGLWRWAKPPPAPKAAPLPRPPERRGPTIAATDAGLSDVDLARATIELGEASLTESDPKAFYREVAQSLAASLEKNPKRPDLQRKLLEVYFTAGMSDEFASLATAYLEENNAGQDPHWQEIGEMGFRMLPNHDLFKQFGRTVEDKPVKRRMQFRRFYDRRIHQGALHAAQQQLAAEYEKLRVDPQFQARLQKGLADGLARPTVLTPAAELGLQVEGSRLLLKREDRARRHDEVLANALTQVLLARQLGIRAVVTATRDGRHGLAVATVAARLGRQCIVYIAESDMRAHYSRVLAIRKLGAQVRPVYLSEESRYNDPRQHALEAWIGKQDELLYVSSPTGGPHPFPMIAGDGHAMVGREAVEQIRKAEGRLPSAVVASAADGYAGIGLLRGFIEEKDVRLYCLDAPEPDESAASAEDSEIEVPDGFRHLREHRYLRDTGRIAYLEGRDADAMRVVEQCYAAGQPILSESARSIAHAITLARAGKPEDTVLVVLTRQDEGPVWSSYQDL